MKSVTTYPSEVDRIRPLLYCFLDRLYAAGLEEIYADLKINI
jgi:hypothetical protein